MAVGADRENYYRLLNVGQSATSAEITRAYRVAIKRAHPDRALPERRLAAEEITKDLNRAYSTLCDPLKRRAYDRTIRQSDIQDQVMNRYVSGLGSASPTGARTADPFASHLKRTMTPSEQRDRGRSDRSAMYSLFSAFLVLLISGIGLLAIFAIVSYVISLF